MIKNISLMPKLKDIYHSNGYAIIPNVINSQTCNKAIKQYEKLKETSGFLRNSKQHLGNLHRSENFFIDKFNKFSNFFENAYSQQIDKQSIIKLGHALHTNKFFEKITFSQAIKDILNDLSIRNPIVVQSMILQKLPRRGSKVTLHQDSTYLLTQPQAITGFWIPLQEVTEQNGCMWVIPQSHNTKLYEEFKIIDGKPNYKFNGPIQFNEQEAIPLHMNKGDLLIMSGRLLHKSNDNTSNKTRYAYTWHTMDQNSKWHQHNWLSIEQIAQYNKKQYL